LKLAYVDPSWLLAIAFEEPGCRRREERLRAFDQLYASNLVEAEVRSALVREALTQEFRA